MKKIILLLVAFNIVFTTYAQDNAVLEQYLKDSLEVISHRVEKQIIKARYMEQQLVSTTDTLKGWEGVNVSLYKYSVKDKAKGTLTAYVYMLNPDARKLASWVITTCVGTTDKLEKKNTDLIIDPVRSASGGQFPVLGTVYENMDGKGFKAYYFKDGVSVFLKNGNQSDIRQINDNNIKGTGKFARIISTTREQYKAGNANINLEGINWLNTVRETYKEAMKSDINKLFIAWAIDHLH